MVRRNAFRWTLATVAMLGAGTASASPINFTGFVDKDMDPAANKSVVKVDVNKDPVNSIFQLPEMTKAGLINGYAIKDIRTSYDAKTDMLYVGVNAWSIAGTAVGTGGANITALLKGKGGVDPADLGGDKSITVAFAGNSPNDATKPGAIVAVAGVPADKKMGGPGIDGFTVAKYKGLTNQGIQYNYGATLTNNLGALAFNPSAAHPDFEFSVKNFSKIAPGLDPTKGFWIKAYAGSAMDNPIGEETSVWMNIKVPQPQGIPEPTTWMAWSLVAGAAASRLRRRRRSVD